MRISTFTKDIEGGKVIKFLVLLFNLLFFVFGISLVGVGAYAGAKYGEFTYLSSIDFASGSRLLIAVGVIIAVISFFGCCGAWKENRCLLAIFFVLLLVMVVLEITSTTLAYRHRHQLAESLKRDINAILEKDYGKDKCFTETIDFLQRKHMCCGVTNWQDWAKVPGYDLSKVPDSCCEKMSKGCGETAFHGKNTPPRNIWERGCYKLLMGAIQDGLGKVAGVAVTVIIIQILGMIFSAYLIRRIRSKETYA